MSTHEKLTIKVKTEGSGTKNDPYRMSNAEIFLGEKKTGFLIQNLVFALSADAMVPLVVITATPMQMDFEFDGPAEVVRAMTEIKDRAFNIQGTPFVPMFAPMPPTRIPKTEFVGDPILGPPMTAEEIKKFWEGGTGLKVDGPEVKKAVEDLKRKSDGEELQGG